MANGEESPVASETEPSPPVNDEAPEENPAEVEDLQAEPVFLKNLRILPPLQKKEAISKDEILDSVALPPIRAEEPVSSIRAALSDVSGYAHLTSFRFVLEHNEKAVATSESNSGVSRPLTLTTLTSPYTGKNAVISIPVAVKSLESEPQATVSPDKATDNPDLLVLDDYSDLTPLWAKGLTDGSCFRIVLERYDAATVKDHIVRLRSLFDGNVPSVTSLADAADEAGSHQNNEEKPETEDDAKETDAEKSDKEDEEDRIEKNMVETDIPTYPESTSVAVDGTNLHGFYYLASGENAAFYRDASAEVPIKDGHNEVQKTKKKGSSKGGKDDAAHENGHSAASSGRVSSEAEIKETVRRLNELEDQTRVSCQIHYSGFHPPPPSRRLMGDLAYLEVTLPGENEDKVFITAVPTGFYVNNSSMNKNGTYYFDPSPSSKPCYAHALLDCLLQKSESLRVAWLDALLASKEGAALQAAKNGDGPFLQLFRVAIRGDIGGHKKRSAATSTQGIDSLIQRPSWLIGLPNRKENDNQWNHNTMHEYSRQRMEDELSNTFGVDIRNGALRDWNEELQSAREMPTSTLIERIERARVIHKVMHDFGEAAVVGVRAIFDGQVAAMNPNEPTRSHVYLHNNIFFSRALDAGVETFKIAKGDNAARKSASRDAQCISTLHRIEKSGLHTLATVMIDFLGTRFVCQSILPGILSGEKTHKLLFGAVEAGSPLVWDSEMHGVLEDVLGKALLIASRPLPRQPLSDERVEEIKRLRIASPLYPEKKDDDTKSPEDNSPTIISCLPIEAKGIRGSDQRKYVLDMTRLAPRDANWVPESQGGTGKWEALLKENGAKNHSHIPQTLDDDEWIVAVLRPETVTSYCRIKMARYLESKRAKNADERENTASTDAPSEPNVSPEVTATEKSEEKTADGQKEITESEQKESVENGGSENNQKERDDRFSAEDEEFWKSLRLNINVFLPDLRSIDDPETQTKTKADEECVREVSAFIWDKLLPQLTLEIREASCPQVPIDGRSLTELLHQRGINCRYLGRLAILAREEEERDQKTLMDLQQGNAKAVERRSMPRFWLEMLECEMVARAAKHVLDKYLTENGGTAAAQPAQTIASFLSALVSEAEETAAQTEMRLSKQESSLHPDDDDLSVLTIGDTGGGGDALPPQLRSRADVWEDIESEVGRRYRYSLLLYNKSGGKSKRALFIPLLRRICQRSGIRLVAKNYEVGGRCLCTSATSTGRLTASYPISPLDIIDVVPLMKHTAAHGEGFTPCGVGGVGGLPSLHVSLPDARTVLEAAHIQYSTGALPKALELAQEAASLYQRVTDTMAHPGVVRCIDVMAAILFDAKEPLLAAANSTKAMGLLVQISGFDSAEVASAHQTLSHILLSSSQLNRGVKHLRAAIYLMELMAGPRYNELPTCYHRLGTVYHQMGDLSAAIRLYQEAAQRDNSDRLFEGMIAKSAAMVFAASGQFKSAIESEKRSYHIFSTSLGEGHQLTKTSDQTLKKFTQLAVEQGSRSAEEAKKRKEEEAADAIASQIEAAEVAEQEKKKKKVIKKKKAKK